MQSSNEMNLLELIRDAFSRRHMPRVLTSSAELSEDEYDEVMHFQGKDWSAITREEVETHYEVIFWFSPEAFCYYLPGIMSAGVRDSDTSLLAYRSLIGMLDRSPDPTNWDDFFLERWPLLSPPECEAVEKWIHWLASKEDINIFANIVSRALVTVELLKSGITAIKTVRSEKK